MSEGGCRIRDDVRDSKIRWDIPSKPYQKFGSFIQARDGLRHHLKHGYNQMGRDFPRTVAGGVGEGILHYSCSLKEYNNCWVRKEVPIFRCTSRIEDFYEWVDIIEVYFDKENLSEELKCILVSYTLENEAEIWWQQLQLNRLKEGKAKISYWPRMKALLFKYFMHIKCSTKCSSNVNNNCKVVNYGKNMPEGRVQQIEDRKQGMEHLLDDTIVPFKCLTEFPIQLNKHGKEEVVNVETSTPSECSTKCLLEPYSSSSLEESNVCKMSDGLRHTNETRRTEASIKDDECSRNEKEGVTENEVAESGNQTYVMFGDQWKKCAIEGHEVGVKHDSTITVKALYDSTTHVVPVNPCNLKTMNPELFVGGFIGNYDSDISRCGSETSFATKVYNAKCDEFQRHIQLEPEDVDLLIGEMLMVSFDPGGNARVNSMVERIWNELNMLSYYRFVDQFCKSILSHLTEMTDLRECPYDIREAAYSLVYVPVSFAGLLELRDLRNRFLKKFGSFVACCASKEFAYKLQLMPPSKDTKLQLMHDTAAESCIKWNRKGLEQTLFKHPTNGQEQWQEEKALIMTEVVYLAPSNGDDAPGVINAIAEQSRNTSLYNLELVIESPTLKLVSIHVVWPCLRVAKPMFRFVPTSVDAYLTPFIKEYLCGFMSKSVEISLSPSLSIKAPNPDPSQLQPSHFLAIDTYTKPVHLMVFNVCRDNWNSLVLELFEAHHYLDTPVIVANLTGATSRGNDDAAIITNLALKPQVLSDGDDNLLVLLIGGISIAAPTGLFRTKTIVSHDFSEHKVDGVVLKQATLVNRQLGVLIGMMNEMFHVVGSVDWKTYDCYVTDRRINLNFLESVCELMNLGSKAFESLRDLEGYGYCSAKMTKPQVDQLIPINVYGLFLVYAVQLTEFCDAFKFKTALRKMVSIQEPFVKVEMLDSRDYIGLHMEYAHHRREFKEMRYLIKEMSLEGHQIGKNDEVFATLGQMLRKAVIFLLFHGHWGYCFTLTRGRVIQWDGWHDENNTDTEEKFILVGINAATIFSRLRLFHKVVNGLDPPMDLDGACEASIWIPMSSLVDELLRRRDGLM